ncbi:MAG: hypothetical protein FD138_4362 [Planctomycetota bacterium]|nr:MAG: hypothetical protein FD138_4362 [Planctomycetota bacterium]
MSEIRPTVPDDLATEARSARRFAMLLIVVVSSAMSFTQIVQSTPLQSANDRSRWSTVWSLVERGTYQIDEIDRSRRFRARSSPEFIGASNDSPAGI